MTPYRRATPALAGTGWVVKRHFDQMSQKGHN
jgi:hypothetical protein